MYVIGKCGFREIPPARHNRLLFCVEVVSQPPTQPRATAEIRWVLRDFLSEIFRAIRAWIKRSKHLDEDQHLRALRGRRFEVTAAPPASADAALLGGFQFRNAAPLVHALQGLPGVWFESLHRSEWDQLLAYCPLENEVLQIRALLQGPLLRLKDLDDQIANLQKAIDALARERDDIRSFVDLHKDLISPFRRLPLDIIREIFAVCLPTHRNCVMSAVEAPVLLGRICSSWRAISLTTPRLWSRLHVVEPSRLWRTETSIDALEKKLSLRLETTKTWLSRSGQCPLSISFQSSSDTPDVDTAATKTRLFMQAIIPFTPRWKEITLHGVPHEALEMLSNLAEDDVTMLQKLNISQHPDSDTPTHVPFALMRVLNLINLTLAAPVSIEDLPVRWENLTYLAVWGQDSSALSCSIVAELLARCSRLQVCSFFINARNSDLSPPEDGASSTIALPFLHSLHISGLPTIDVGNLFRRLSVPGLRDVDLRGSIANNFGKHPFVADFLAFLGVSSCFETLTIDTQLVIPSSFMELLRGLPASTTCLRIADCLDSWDLSTAFGLFDDDMLAVLTPTPENPGSCPALQKLHIIRCWAPSDTALLQFIHARMAVSPRTLETVMIKFSREMHFDFAAYIQPFLDDGRLKIITTYTRSTAVEDFSPWEGLPDAPNMIAQRGKDDF
ncbi:hypothetical protein B0H16DRAFT_1693696 [Mycena metata]|uniref:F-box domain-containing protein n=1 Tax=Mycena metata TaxID=1033252 RepID=A0AAD7IJL2_9AGAR|nr:hypothetical protein B0H16DRAFT_1693696 [Mycena metata]